MKSLVPFLMLMLLITPAQRLVAQPNNEAERLPDDRYERIYVPENALAEYWSQVEPGVLVDRNEFEQLLQNAEQATPGPEGRPVQILIEHVAYEVVLQGDVIAVTANCRISKSVAGWACLPLPIRQVTLEKATWKGQPAPLGLSGPCEGPVMITDFVGADTLTLEMTLPVVRAGTDELGTLSLIPGVPSTLSVEVPAGRRLRFNGDRLEESQKAADARTITLPAGGAAQAQLQWTDAIEESLDESLVFAQTVYAVGLERDSLDWQTVTQIDSYGKRFSRLEFSVPSRLEITDVAATGLEAWELLDDPEDPQRTQVVLTFREVLPERTRVTMRGIQLATENEEWTVATLQLKGATTHTGGLSISSPGEIRVKTLAMEGIRPATRNWKAMEGFTPQGPMRFYDWWQSDFVFRLAVDETTGEVQAAVSQRLDLQELEMSLLAAFTLQSLFAPLYEVQADLPEGWTVDLVQQDAAPIEWQYVSRGEGGARIRIPLNPPLAAGQKRSISILVRQSRVEGEDGGGMTFSLPEINLDNVQILEGAYTVAGSPRLEVVPQEITGMDPVFLGTPEELFSYRYQNAEIDGRIEVQRKPSRFNVMKLTTVDADEQSIAFGHRVELDISGGGLRELQIELPALIPVKGEFQISGDARISRQRQREVDEKTVWDLTFDRYVTGTIRLSLQLVLPREDAESMSVPLLQFKQAELQEQYVAFLADEEQYVDVTATSQRGTAVSPIDPTDLPMPAEVGTKRVVTGYHLIEPDATIEFTLDEFTAHAVPRAVGQQLLIDTLLVNDSHIQQQAQLTLLAAGVQSLLVALPEGAVLWSATVDGTPMTVRKLTQGFIVPLPATGTDGTPRAIRLLYRRPAATTTGTWTERLDVPEFRVDIGQSETMSLPIMQTDWKVHHAVDTVLMPVDENVELISQPRRSTWLERVWERLQTLTWSTLITNLLIGLVVVGVVAGLTLLRNHFGYSVSIVALLVLVIVLPIFLLLGGQSARRSARILNPAGAEQMTMEGLEATPADDRYLLGDFENNNGQPLPATIQSLDTLSVGGGNDGAANGVELQLAKPQSAPDAPANPFAATTEPAQQSNSSSEARQVDELAANLAGQADLPQRVQAPQAGKPLDGLMSLAVGLQIPEGLRTTHLQTFRVPENVRVRVLSEELVWHSRWLVAAIVALVCWLMRELSWAKRLLVSVILFGIPLALIGVTPRLFDPVLEGVLIGTWIGLFGWMLRTTVLLIARGCRTCGRFFAKLSPASAAAGLGLLLFCSGSYAEDKVPAAQLAVPKADSVQAEKIPLVFPYAQGTSPLAAQRVFVPKDHYLDLWRATHTDDFAEPAPLDHQVSEASYVVRVQPPGDGEPASRQAVSMQARYVVRSYRDQPQLVPLPIAPLLLQSIEVNGKPVTASTDAGVSTNVLVGSKGLHLVDVNFLIPASAIGSAGQFSVRLDPVAAGSMSFALPAADVQLRVNDGEVPYELVERDGTTYAEFAVAEGGEYRLSWQPKVSSAQLQFLSSESTRQVLVREVGVELRYAFKFQIAQGSFSEVLFELPASVALKSLSGQDLAGWQKQADGRLRVLLKRSVEDSTTIAMSLFAPLSVSTERQQFVCPDVIPQGVTREIGTWAVGWEPLLDVVVSSTQGVRQLGVEQFKPIDNLRTISTIERVYRFSGRPQEITLEIRREPTQADVTHYTLLDLQPHKTQVATVLDAVLKGEPRLSIDVALPAGMQVVEVQGQAIQDWFHTAAGPNESETLTVLFSSPQQGKIRVAVRGFIQQELNETSQLELQGLRMSGATTSREYLGVGASAAFGVIVTDAGSAQTLAAEKLPDVMRSVAQFPLRIGFFQSRVDSTPVTIRLTREDAQLKASSVTVIAVTDVSIDYGISLQWKISKAGTDRFAFVGPTWMQERIEFESDGIRQIRTEKVDDQRTRWIIETRTPQSSAFFASAVISLPYPADQTVRTPLIRFIAGAADGEGESPELDIQGNYAVLVNLGQQTLEPISQHDAYLVSRNELPLQVPDSLVQRAMEIIRVTPAVVPSWELKPLEEQESPAATIFFAELTTVIDRPGTYRTQVTYTVKNRRRQFLPVMLPEGEQLLSVLVNNQAARAVRRTVEGQELHLVPLPPGGAANLAYEVRLVTQGALDAGLGAAWWGRALELKRPDILSRDTSSEFGVPVLYTVWRVSTPDDYIVTAVEGAATNMGTAESRAVSDVRVYNRLQELSELAEIARSKAYSYKQRALAVSNYESLKKGLADAAQEGEVNESIQQQIQAAETSPVEFGDQQALMGEPVSGAESQSLGRLFVLGCNQDIQVSNGFAEQNRGVNSGLDRNGSVNFSTQHFQLEKATPPVSDKKNKDLMQFQERELNRRMLLEESVRQNSIVIEQNQQSMGRRSGVSKGAAPGESKSEREQLKRFAVPQSRTEDLGLTYSFSDFAVVPEITDERAPEMGMGGAFGMERLAEQAVPSRGEAVIGLSLPIALPVYGQTTVFSKVGGDPQLTIRVQSSERVGTLLGWGWLVLCSGLIVALVIVSVRASDPAARRRPVSGVLILMGLALFVILPSGSGWLAMLLLIGACIAAFRKPKEETPTESAVVT
ncbi:hypothetical protein [Rubinisphaera margarita]|uniref:hypothetical protein n=1 Tax=Rubinisphaera margarita TaxID=2909586 RepID=UPI001EE8B9C4|nr:hypothetical protein [Rubinisphaera margarita]MCG6157656.1 hypothetical protein [Rubinisphaera margarita]